MGRFALIALADWVPLTGFAATGGYPATVIAVSIPEQGIMDAA